MRAKQYQPRHIQRRTGNEPKHSYGRPMLEGSQILCGYCSNASLMSATVAYIKPA